MSGKSVHLKRKDGMGRMPDDLYETDFGTIRSCLWFLDRVAFCRHGTILDPGAGSGRWGEVARECWPEASLYGLELRTVERPASYDGWHQGDFLTFDGDGRRFDLVVGNPPYRDAAQWVRHAHGLLSSRGTVAFLLRLAFLEGQNRRDNLFRLYPPTYVAVCSKRPSFQDDLRTNATAFAMLVWQPFATWVPFPQVHFLPTIKEK